MAEPFPLGEDACDKMGYCMPGGVLDWRLWGNRRIAVRLDHPWEGQALETPKCLITTDGSRKVTTKNPFSQELEALRAVLEALEPLEAKSREFVFKTAAERLELALDTVPPEVGGRNATTPASNRVREPGDQPTSKQFLREKKPTSDIQRVAVLAYYLTHYGEKETFNTQDIVQLNTDAGGTKIGNPHRAVDNATRQARILIPVAGGNKKITTHGEDLVDALPDQDAIKEVLREARASGVRRPARRAGAKAAKRAPKAPR